MPTYLLSAGVEAERLDAIEKSVKPLIPGLKRIQTVQDIDKQAEAAGPGQNFVLVALPAAESGQFEKLFAIVARYSGKIFFILISRDISGADYKRLVQTGGADWVSETANPAEIADIIASRQKTPKPAAPAANPPAVLCFVPSAGGVGNTTLAVETAVQLKKGSAGKDRKVCLVDLDFQSGRICDYLDIPPQLKLDDFIETPQRLDAQLLEIFISRHPTGVHVLAARRSKFASWGIALAPLDQLFGMIAARYDYILIAMPIAWFPWTAHMLAASNGVLVTGVNTIPGLHLVSETLTAVRREAEATAQVRAVLNRCDHGFMGRIQRTDHVVKVLGDEKVIYVQNTPRAIESVNTGTPMSIGAPGDRAVKQIGEIAALCLALRERDAAQK